MGLLSGSTIAQRRILESLQYASEDDAFFEGLRDCTNCDIEEAWDYLAMGDATISEATMVTFGGQMFPRSGYAVVMAGGAGSGKGYVRANKLAIDAKTIDVDQLKELYIKAAKKGRLDDDREYDLGNPQDVTDLHVTVRNKGFKDKMEGNFYKAHETGERPNLIYDITGDDPNKLADLGRKMKEAGYKTSLVWVVTSRQVAMLQNLSRPRVVSQSILHATHNNVAKAVFPFLKSQAKDYDEAWLVFNSKDTAKTLTPEERRELDDMGTIKLEKSGNNFAIPKEIEDRLMKVLGPMEDNPDSPTTYRDFSEIRGNENELERIRQGTASLLRKVS